MWTFKKIQELAAAGKIRGYKAPTPTPSPVTGGRKVAKYYPTGDKAKNWISLFLLAWCQQRGIVLEEEFRFHETRKWRFDYAVPTFRWAVEYEGLLPAGKKTGHQDSKRYSDNCDKYNAASAMGWTVIRVTYLNYMTLTKTFQDLEKLKRDA